MKSVVYQNGLATIQSSGISEIAPSGRSQTSNQGLLVALAANILWGTSFLASKYTLISWGPFTASALRFALASIFIFLALRIIGKKIRIPASIKDWTWVFIIASSGFGFLYPLQLTGLQNISSGLSAAIMLTSPLFVVALGRFTLNDKFNINKIIALIFGVVGGLILLNSTGSLKIENNGMIAGSLLTLAASISLSISVIATRKLIARLDTGSLTFWAMTTGVIQISIAAIIIEKENAINFIQSGTFVSWISLFYLSLICSALCFFLWNFAISKSPPKEIASTMHIKTPTAVILGVLIAGEFLGFEIILGTILVSFGVWLSQRQRQVKNV